MAIKVNNQFGEDDYIVEFIQQFYDDEDRKTIKDGHLIYHTVLCIELSFFALLLNY